MSLVCATCTAARATDGPSRAHAVPVYHVAGMHDGKPTWLQRVTSAHHIYWDVQRAEWLLDDAGDYDAAVVYAFYHNATAVLEPLPPVAAM